MTADILPSRRKFAGPWDEIDYLYHKLLYWFYQREDARRARPFARRLKRLLKKAAAGQEAIFPEGCWALLHEVDGDLPKAIEHRAREIDLIKRLHKITRKTPSQDFVLDRYGYDDLSDRLDLLAILYHDSGDLNKAISTLRESKEFCDRHGIPFDGKDLLKDYLQERRTTPTNGRRAGASSEG